MRQHRKVTHSPVSSHQKGYPLSLVAWTPAELQPQKQALPARSPALLLLLLLHLLALQPSSCGVAGPHQPDRRKPWPQPAVGLPNHRDKLTKKFRSQSTKPFKGHFLQCLSIQRDLQQLIPLKSTGRLPLPSAGEGLKGTHLMHQQFARTGAASAYVSSLPSPRPDLRGGQSPAPLTRSSYGLLRPVSEGSNCQQAH